MFYFLLLILAFVGNTEAGIYGPDSRADLYEVKDPKILELARSTVAIVSTEPTWVRRELVTWKETRPNQVYAKVERTEIDPKTGDLIFHPLFLKDFDSIDSDENKLCSDERFIHQLTISHCSGALIAPDIVITAGHCIPGLDQCKTTQVVFGYQAANEKDVGRSRYPRDDVYSCAEVIRVSAPKRFESRFSDYTIFRLDRPVVGRKPLKVNQRPDYRLGQKLFTIGHPAGLPSKYSSGKVHYLQEESTPPNRFLDWLLNTTVTSYAGNSGGPVFDARTHEIVGLIEGGDDDFELDAQRSCLKSIVYPLKGIVDNGLVKHRTMVTKTSWIDFTGVLH